MTTMTTTVREQATDNYTRMWASLIRDAREAERTHRPTLATELRRQAAWVHRAALAEEVDEAPKGLGDLS